MAWPKNFKRSMGMRKETIGPGMSHHPRERVDDKGVHRGLVCGKVGCGYRPRPVRPEGSAQGSQARPVFVHLDSKKRSRSKGPSLRRRDHVSFFLFRDDYDGEV